MNPVPIDEIAHSMVRMRSSLARVELAASRLARASRQPATRLLAEGVSESVREIDEEIDQNLRMLRPDPAMEHESANCSDMLQQIEERTAPILDAHAIEWSPTSEKHPALQHDRVAFERAAFVLLRSGIAMAGRGGRLALALCDQSDESRLGLRLETKRLDPSPIDAAPPVDASYELRAFAQRCGFAIDIDIEGESEGESRLTLWMTSAEVGS